MLQEEALFRALLFRVQTSADKVHLLDRSEAALNLILNRASDQFLRKELTAKIARLVADLPNDLSAGPGRLMFVKAVEACLSILRTAEQERIISPAPAVGKPMAPVESAASYERLAGAARHPHHVEKKTSPWHITGLIAALVVVLAIGLAIAFRDRGGEDQQVRPLIAQMEAATRGNIPASNIFGGALRVSVQNGRTVVTVEGIPAGECVSAGWDLVRKGILTVNGVTPNRVSAAKLNDLCHDEDTATLIWSPKANAE